MRTAILMGLSAVLSAGQVSAEPPLSWTLEMSAGSSKIDKGGEKTEAFVDGGLAVAAAFGKGEAFAAVYRITTVGDRREFFDDELEFSLGYARPLSTCAWELAVTSVSVPGDSEPDEMEFSGAVEFNTLFSPTVETLYNATAKETGIAISAGHQWEFDRWTLGTQAAFGYLTVKDDEPLAYGALRATADYTLLDTITIGSFVELGTSDTDGFLTKVNSGGLPDRATSGIAFGITLIVER
jgi:hypothetical protein